MFAGSPAPDVETPMRLKSFALAGIAAVMFAAPALAHHSFAMFDGNKKVTLEGTVKEFTWTYPHAWVVMMVADPAGGQPKQWSLELQSPAGLARNGWVPKSLTPGMKISAEIHPLKNGASGGAGVKFTLADGKVLTP
jgi:hypothetical protein